MTPWLVVKILGTCRQSTQDGGRFHLVSVGRGGYPVGGRLQVYCCEISDRFIFHLVLVDASSRVGRLLFRLVGGVLWGFFPLLYGGSDGGSSHGNKGGKVTRVDDISEVQCSWYFVIFFHCHLGESLEGSVQRVY